MPSKVLRITYTVIELHNNVFLQAVIFLMVVAQVLGAPSYHGPEAKPVVLPSGHLADTHEVAALKSLHLGALSQASSHGHGDHHDDGDHGHSGAAYHGPHALPKVYM